MIGRFWRGWTAPDRAAAYAALLRSEVLPGIHRVPGYQGGMLFRREVPEGVEFATLTLFETQEAVRAFAGERYELAVVPPEARRLLSRFDETSLHFEAEIMPGSRFAAPGGR
jgi:heme-degrading monooxygenase HmoA